MSVSEGNSDELSYERIRTLITNRLARNGWAKDWDQFEDAVQQGVIRAWKDRQAGRHEREDHLVRRAVLEARSYVKPDTDRLPFGYPGVRRDTTGFSKAEGDAKREKIYAYRKEFISLHDRKPTNKEISDATGIRLDAVGRMLKEGLGHNTPRGRLDRAWLVVPMSEVAETEQDLESDPYVRGRVTLNVEDQILTEMYSVRLLGYTKRDNAIALCLFHMAGWTYKEIQSYFGKSSGWVQNRLKEGVEDIRTQVAYDDWLQMYS